MANTSRANGFTPVKTLSGAPISSMIRSVYSPAADRSSDTTNNHGDLYIGDPITIGTDGTVTPADSNELVSGVVVGIGAASAVNHGATGSAVVPAPMFYPADLTRKYLPLTEAGWVYYVPVNDVLFEVQTASDLDLLPGKFADTNIVANTAHGSRTTGRSNVELTTASDNDVIVVENVMTPDNDITSAYARHLVLFYTQGITPASAT